MHRQHGPRAIVDEDALVRELVSGRIRAGLDVFVHEPEVPQELVGLPNVVLAPHLGTALASAREAMTRVLVDSLLALRAGRNAAERRVVAAIPCPRTAP